MMIARSLVSMIWKAVNLYLSDHISAKCSSTANRVDRASVHYWQRSHNKMILLCKMRLSWNTIKRMFDQVYLKYLWRLRLIEQCMHPITHIKDRCSARLLQEVAYNFSIWSTQIDPDWLHIRLTVLLKSVWIVHYDAFY